MVATAFSSSCFGKAGLTLWLLADAIDATRKQATLATSPIHLRSYARVGSRRRVNHPGEYEVGVMTAHPAWPQSEYDQNRGGIVGPFTGRPS